MGLFDWLSRRDRSCDAPGSDGAVPGSTTEDAATDTWPSDLPVEDEVADDGEHHRLTKERMLYPRGRFQGDHIPPQNIAFDHNLQEFAQRVAFICSLENSGKITPDDAHSQIRDLYQELSRTHSGLGIADA